jgi:hypothetical protein
MNVYQNYWLNRRMPKKKLKDYTETFGKATLKKSPIVLGMATMHPQHPILNCCVSHRQLNWFKAAQALTLDAEAAIPP